MKRIEPFGPFALAPNVTPVAVPSPAGELSGLLTGPSAPVLVDGTPAISAVSAPGGAGENRALLVPATRGPKGATGPGAKGGVEGKGGVERGGGGGGRLGF